MSVKARILARLYTRGTVTKEGLRQSVADSVITDGEYLTITGEAYE